ncbi:plastocyanin/azurin family copper-binding protein [Haloarchaeobius sp. DFWS5]|uniref:plastocyanin/azurin family copper-binding protein n=1 Tax=Haloarchaeobius sp. DFWS5 TaxID=3446114 RepID=UPI003EBF7AF5
MTTRRRLLRAGALALPVAVAGCLGAGGSESTEREVPENTVLVGPDGEYVFTPTELTVSVGTTVTFDWRSNTHNVVVREQPDAANWRGTGDQSKTFDDGHTYEYEFTVPGTYEYVCTPHEGLGMDGAVVVEE